MQRVPSRPARALALVAVVLVVGVVAAAVALLVTHTSSKPSSQASRTGNPAPAPAPATGSSPARPALRCATARHPQPVVLVPGTFQATSWTAISDGLAAQGYCVNMFQDSRAGTGPIAQSARELRRYVNRVLAYTHATRVSIVGHSEGGVTARYYVKSLGGTAKVQDLVALAPPNHGTTTPLVIPGAMLGCVACGQQAAGSSFLATLNAGNGAPPPVNYTVLETSYDLVVTPYQSAFLSGPASRITNVVLQDACPSDLATHLTVTSDPVAVQWVEEALARNGPADPAFKPQC